MRMNTRTLACLVVCASLCWSAKHTVPFTDSDMVDESLDALELFKPSGSRTTTAKPKDPPPVAASTVPEPSSTATRQSPDKPITSEPPEIKPAVNTATRIEQLVDKGCGSEHFKLLEFIGSGSSGKVYKALPLSTHAKEKVAALSKKETPEGGGGEKQVAKAAYSSQWVAVKVVEIESDNKNRIAKELRIMRQLGQHPHLVHFISAHMHRKDKAVWIAMGWIEGDNLGGIVDEHARVARSKRRSTPAFDEQQTRRLAVPLFDALAAVHSLGSTHGDIDVSNIMTSQGVPVLIDVGDGHFEPNQMGMDILMLTYALLECSVKPVMSVSYEGPIPLKHYDSDRRRAIKKVLSMVARGKFAVPEGMRAFVKDIVNGVKETTTANDPLILQHPFLNEHGIEVKS